MHAGTIVINRDYQRTDAVWPPAARSYLIDTILKGFPMPKFSLSQQTDLKSRKTIKEIVDGQQRSKAIVDFFDGKLRLSGKSEFSGKLFSQLEQENQQRFIDYSITADVFVGATENEIREVFRRMNSYTVPLNPQEKRHATHQGDFKWFIVEMTRKYAGALKSIGVFSERQLSRMADAALLSEVVMAMTKGIETSSQRKIDAFYTEKDPEFIEEPDMTKRLDEAFSRILVWEQLHNGNLMKPFHLYCLVPAISHCVRHLPSLVSVYDPTTVKLLKDEALLANLGALAQALESPTPPKRLAAFVQASTAATNTKNHRETRFRFFCQALSSKSFP
jgi:hypothetical protein